MDLVKNKQTKMIYGLCDMGLAKQPSLKNQVLNSSIYIQFPLKSAHKIDFIHMWHYHEYQ